MKQMSQAEMRVWARGKLGWECYSWIIGRSTPRTFWGYRLAGQSSRLAFHACHSEQEAHDLADRTLPDPTQRIADAWALKEWFRLNATDEMKERFNNPPPFRVNWWIELADLPEKEAATWICCAVYYAWTGERVEVV